MIKKYSQLNKTSNYEGLDYDPNFDVFYEVPKNFDFKGLKSKNNNKLIAYQWIRKPDVREHPIEGLIDVKVSDMSRANKCTDCGRKIVHVFWVQDESGRIKPYGSEHVHTALGLPVSLNKTKIDKLILEMQYEEKLRLQRKKELLESATEDINVTNRTWKMPEHLYTRPFQDYVIKPFSAPEYKTVVYEKDGKYKRIAETSQRDIELLTELGFTPVSEAKKRYDIHFDEDVDPRIL